MVVVDPMDEAIAVQTRKKLGRSSEYGQKEYGGFEYGEQDDKFGIYQVRGRFEEQVITKSKFYWPFNPQTEIQQANRQKMTNAVVAWQNLTAEQKDVYNKKAIGTRLSGYNLFLSEYLLSN